MKKILLLLVCLLGGIVTLSAQSSEKLEQAKILYYRGKYELALQLITNARLARTDKEARFLQALCQYHLNRLDPALATLKTMADNEKAPYPEAWLFIGKIYHARQQFEEAANYYKLYLRSLRPDDPSRAMLIEDIRRCDNGLRNQFKITGVVVENMGDTINTPGDEFAPVPSLNQTNRLYFSSIRAGNTGGARNEQGLPDEQLGEYFSDMFSCEMKGGRWTGVERMHFLLNSAQHECLIDFSPDGVILFYQQGMKLNEGPIFADTFRRDEQRRLRTTPLSGVVDPSQGDQHPFFYYDTLVVFASRRPGGFGGLDLYRASRKGNVWSQPVNMGPTINSAFDETTPFLARDGRTLYYSTNNSNYSIGGLDVMKAVYLPEAERWSEPENMGIPINSAGDDTHFRLSRDGHTGFLASSRKDGYGKRDLYMAFFQTYRAEMEPPAVNFISQPSPDQPPHQPQPPRPTASQSSFFVITPSNERALSVSAHQAILNQVHQLLLQNPSLHLVISAYHPADEAILAGLFPGIRQTQQISDYFTGLGIAADRIFQRSLPATAAQGRYLELSFSQFERALSTVAAAIPVIGKRQAEAGRGLVFNRELMYKVQIVSVKAPYQNDALRRFDVPMVENAPGGSYRYTLGACATFAEASSLRRQLESSGFRGCFIAAYVHGERIDTARARLMVNTFPDLSNLINNR